MIDYYPLNMSGRERIVSVDIIKGLAILSVIVFHTYSDCFPLYIDQILGRGWNVAVFFVVAGFFISEEDLDNPINFIKKKLKRLYIPAAIIYALCVLLHNVFVSIGWYPLGEIHPGNGIPYDFYGIRDVLLRLLKVLFAGGSGELVMGAMWFLYSLLYAFIGIAFLNWIIRFFIKRKEIQFYLMTILLLILAVISCILTHCYGYIVSRFSTSLTAMFLIWWGMILNQKIRWNYDDIWFFIISLILFVQCIVLSQRVPVLARNQYQDLLYLVVGSSSLVYIWGYLGNKIQLSLIGRFLSLLGRESLYLMAFHIFGFFICNSLLMWIGVFNTSEKKEMYTFAIGDNYLLLILYLIMAITVSLGIVFVWRYLRNIVSFVI